MLGIRRSHTQGFTLIELLIVVAIIAILAAIAVPNFLEAQLRAKVGRTKSDLRTISMGMESYAIDTNGKYPILNGYANTSYSGNLDRGGIFLAWGLSTPVAYVTTTRYPDPFVKVKVMNTYGELTLNTSPGQVDSFGYMYVNCPLCRQEYANKTPYKDNRPAYFLMSEGPDQIRGPHPDDVVQASHGHSASATSAESYLADYATAAPSFSNPNLTFDCTLYDPSNGTISGGDIIRHP